VTQSPRSDSAVIRSAGLLPGDHVARRRAVRRRVGARSKIRGPLGGGAGERGVHRLGDDDGPKELSLTLDEAEVLAEALTQLIAEARAGA